jgi:protease I
MAQQISGKRVAALATNGFEQDELTGPKQALEAAGATVHVVSPDAGTIRGWKHTEWGDEIKVDRTLDAVKADDYDALLLPGGVMNADKLRMNPRAVQLAKQFFDQGKPIAVICHGPWALIEAGVVSGVQMTSYPSIKTDLINAGAHWVDQEVVVDRGIVSSRKPEDIPAFNRKTIEEIAEGQHGGGGRRQPAAAHA